MAARKGGTGKTTLAVHLALAAHLRGYEVVLVDADPQRSATQAMCDRVGSAPMHLNVTASDLRAIKRRPEITKAHRVVVDTPGASGPITSEAMSQADLVLLVARPTFLDIAAAVRTFAEARHLGVPSLIVLNQAPPARGGEEHVAVSKSLEALRSTNLPVSAAIVHSRLAFQTSIASGLSVEEFAASPAAAEISALWTDVEANLAGAQRIDRTPTSLPALRMDARS